MTNNADVVKIRTAAQIEKRFDVIRTIVALLIALVLVFILIAFVSHDPFRDFGIFLFGPLESIGRISILIQKLIPLLFTGTAVCLMYACGQINLAAEGSFFSGAIASTAVAITSGIATGLHPVLCILAGGIAGAIVCGIPAIMDVKFNVWVVVSSLMINYVCLYFGLHLILNVFRDPHVGYVGSYKFAETAKLPIIFPHTGIHLGLVIGLFVIVGCYLLLYRSTFGYSVRMIGINKSFAKYSGIKVGSIIISVQMLAGFIAGAGGSIEVIGMYNRLNYSGFTNHGWDGIMLAVLARNNPKYVPLAALFLAYIRTAAEVLNRMSSLPTELVKIIQAVIIIFICAKMLLYKSEYKAIIKNSKQAISQ